MTYEELKAEADKMGYKLQKRPLFDCSCYVEYPNEAHKMKNGRWRCVDKYEPVEVTNVINKHSGMTHCRRKDKKSGA